jgi:quercetin dioxygenase-like cupin family protein
MSEPAPRTVEPPDDADFVHGSGGTRFFMEGEADYPPIDEDGRLTILNVYELALQMSGLNTVDVHGAKAKGLPLLTNGKLGCDMLYVPPGESFPYHVHPGHHLLLSIGGLGSVTFGDTKQDVRPGELYMIEAEIPHAVGAAAHGPGHWLISFGSPHKRVDAHDRMEEVGK